MKKILFTISLLLLLVALPLASAVVLYCNAPYSYEDSILGDTAVTSGNVCINNISYDVSPDAGNYCDGLTRCVNGQVNANGYLVGFLDDLSGGCDYVSNPVLDVGNTQGYGFTNTAGYRVNFTEDINGGGGCQEKFILNGSGTDIDPYQIYNCTELQFIRQVATYGANFSLMNNIDCSDTVNWNADAGFLPIGNSTDVFTGRILGNGYEVQGLYINSTTGEYTGLIGLASNFLMRDLNLLNVSISSDFTVGCAVGRVDVLSDGEGLFNVSCVGGSVYSTSIAGGLAGRMSGSGENIKYCYTNITVSSPTNFVGGISGNSGGGSIINMSHSDSIVIGSRAAGLVGAGLTVGRNFKLYNSYFTGFVNGTSSAAGITYVAGQTTVIYNSYVAAQIYSGTAEIGAFSTFTHALAQCNGTYYDSEVTGLSDTNCSATPKTTAEMQNQSTFVGWDFVNIWEMTGYPSLRSPLISTPSFNESDITRLYKFEASRRNTVQDMVGSSQTGSPVLVQSNANNFVSVQGAYKGRGLSRYNGYLTMPALNETPKTISFSLYVNGTICSNSTLTPGISYFGHYGETIQAAVWYYDPTYPCALIFQNESADFTDVLNYTSFTDAWHVITLVLNNSNSWGFELYIDGVDASSYRAAGGSGNLYDEFVLAFGTQGVRLVESGSGGPSSLGARLAYLDELTIVNTTLEPSGVTILASQEWYPIPQLYDLTVNQTTILLGESIEFCWNTTTQTSYFQAYKSSSAGNVILSNTPGVQCIIDSPNRTSGYKLYAEGNFITTTDSAFSEYAGLDITGVNGSYVNVFGPPIINSFTSNNYSIREGRSAILSFNVEGALGFGLSDGVDLDLNGINVSGLTSYTVYPLTNTTYTLVATNLYGTVNSTLAITVTQNFINACGNYDAGFDYYLSSNITLNQSTSIGNACIVFTNSNASKVTNFYGNGYSFVDTWGSGNKSFNYFISIANTNNRGIANIYNVNYVQTNETAFGAFGLTTVGGSSNMVVNLVNTSMGGTFSTISMQGQFFTDLNRGNFTITNLRVNTINLGSAFSGSGNLYIYNAYNQGRSLYQGSNPAGQQAIWEMHNSTFASTVSVLQRTAAVGRPSNFSRIILQGNNFSAPLLFPTGNAQPLQIDSYNITGNIWFPYSLTCNDTNTDNICDNPFTTLDGYIDYAPIFVPTCSVNADCGLCQYCSSSRCVNQTNTDYKNECGTSVIACGGIGQFYTLYSGFCGNGTGVCNITSAPVTSGRVCLDENNEDVYASAALYCDIKANCFNLATVAQKFYVGFTNDYSGLCDNTDWQNTGVPQIATGGYIFNQTEIVNNCSESIIYVNATTVVEPITTGTGSVPAESSIIPINGIIDYTNVTTLVIIAPTVGINVDFTGQSVDFDTLDTTSIIITQNSVSIDSTLAPQLNVPARLTFTNIGPGAVILRNGQPCSWYYCSNEQYIGTTLSFDVTGFSTYTVSEEVAAGCTNTRNIVFAAFALIAISLVIGAAFLLIQFNGDFTAFLILAISSIGLAIALFVGYFIITAVQNAICVV